MLSWRGAGIEDPRRGPDLPFFITWDIPPALHPGAETPAHPCGATGITTIEIAGDPARFGWWVGGAQLPVDVRPGDEPGIVAVTLTAPGGPIELR